MPLNDGNSNFVNHACLSGIVSYGAAGKTSSLSRVSVIGREQSFYRLIMMILVGKKFSYEQKNNFDIIYNTL
ncbi:MAG: hypothetical protein IPP29_16805 [Bacteroidetes bacterium]|nr:hypothetical protein [Bacteroidota bacterium]